MSIFVTPKLVNPETLAALFSITRSSQPHLLLLPVVTPYSNPFSLIQSPTSFSCSVGKGPFPTLVVYPFTIPTALSIIVGPIPAPVHIPPATVLEDVTYGYEPKSISRSVPWAPSNNTFLFAFMLSKTLTDASSTNGFILLPYSK